MDKRFTFKDLVLFGLLAGVLVVIALAMFQYDRQWDTLKKLEKSVADQNEHGVEQAKQIDAMRKLVERGLVAAPSNGTTTSPSSAPAAQAGYASAKGDPFARQQEAMKLPGYATGDWLMQMFPAKVSKLTPLLSSDTYASIVQNRIYEALAFRDPETLQWQPQLAVDWSIDSAGTTIETKLRRGVTFSDGTPFTADDVVFTVDWIRTPEVDAPRARSGFEPVESVTKVDDYTVRWKFKRPYFEALTLVLSFQPMSKAQLSKYSPQGFNEAIGLVLGTGQYRLESPDGWRPGKPIVLYRNERYWGVPGPFNRIYYQEIEEDAAALTMFRNGDLDTYGATPDQYEKLKDDPQILKRANKYEYYFRDGGYTYVAWNEQRKGQPTLFTDKRARQAMTLLIDRERIARDVYRGYGKAAVGPFGVASQQNDPAIKPWPYDPKRATTLLAELGFTKKNDRGVLVDDSGREFRFKLCYSNKNPNTERIVLQIKDSLARYGIVLEQEPTDWPIMIKKLDNRDFDAITLGWTGGTETDVYQMFHSDNIKDNGDNYMSYSSADCDKQIETARATVDEKLRMPIWRKVHSILQEDQPYTFLCVNQALQFVDKRIENVKQTKSGLNYFGQDNMPVPWFVPTGSQKHTE